MASRQPRELKKWLTARRAQFKLEQQLDYIDFVEDVLVPATEAVASGTKVKIEKTNAAVAASAIKAKVKVKELGDGE